MKKKGKKVKLWYDVAFELCCRSFFISWINAQCFFFFFLREGSSFFIMNFTFFCLVLNPLYYLWELPAHCFQPVSLSITIAGYVYSLGIKRASCDPRVNFLLPRNFRTRPVRVKPFVATCNYIFAISWVGIFNRNNVYYRFIAWPAYLSHINTVSERVCLARRSENTYRALVWHQADFTCYGYSVALHTFFSPSGCFKRGMINFICC